MAEEEKKYEPSPYPMWALSTLFYASAVLNSTRLHPILIPSFYLGELARRWGWDIYGEDKRTVFFSFILSAFMSVTITNYSIKRLKITPMRGALTAAAWGNAIYYYHSWMEQPTEKS